MKQDKPFHGFHSFWLGQKSEKNAFKISNDANFEHGLLKTNKDVAP